MNLQAVKKAAGEFYLTVRDKGISEALNRTKNRIHGWLNPEKTPLERVNPITLFSMDEAGLRKEEKRAVRATGFLFDSSQVDKTYPLVFEQDGLFMRYVILPAVERCRGIVVYFHGHDAYLHMGSMQPWKHFDVLALWDTFGYNRQGSWFWGEKGKAFVEDLTKALIEEVRLKYPGKPWFCAGASMGGVGLSLSRDQVWVFRIICRMSSGGPTPEDQRLRR